MFLPGESLGQRSLEGFSPWGPQESDKTEQLTLLLSPVGLRSNVFQSYSDCVIVWTNFGTIIEVMTNQIQEFQIE